MSSLKPYLSETDALSRADVDALRGLTLLVLRSGHEVARVVRPTAMQDVLAVLSA